MYACVNNHYQTQNKTVVNEGDVSHLTNDKNIIKYSHKSHCFNKEAIPTITNGLAAVLQCMCYHSNVSWLS